MFLNRVRVPNFRVLKDVDITFEKEFNRSIFPLGSQNGGGKSTLLQLIFVLLHCSTKPERLPFLQNILSGFNMEKNTDESCLAIFTILDGDKNLEVEFLVKRSSWFFTELSEIRLGKYNNDLSQINQELKWLSTNFNSLKLEQGMIQGCGQNPLVKQDPPQPPLQKGGSRGPPLQKGGRGFRGYSRFT